MRLMLILELYDEYLRDFARRNAGPAARPFAEQLERLLDDGFWWQSALARRLSELGHEVFFAFSNAETLQRAWAAEHGLAFDPRDYLFSVPLAQARAFKPDLVWIGSMFPYYGKFLKEMRDICPRVLAWIACPAPAGLDLSNVDAIFTSHENLADQFRARGKRCAVMRPAFEPRVLDKLGRPERDIPFSFVGSFSWYHKRRLRLLDQAVRRTPLRLWGKGTLAEPGFLGWHYVLKYYCPWLRRTALERRYQGQAWGLDMYRVLCRSQLALNVHGDVAEGRAGNMRMFEATGCGALLLTENAPNIGKMFAPGREVVVYDGIDDLVEKANYYLAHEGERNEIARAGQARTLREHSSPARAREFPAIVKELGF
jgi:hypothetical protein